VRLCLRASPALAEHRGVDRLFAHAAEVVALRDPY
jgi:hypothetical protein